MITWLLFFAMMLFLGMVIGIVFSYTQVSTGAAVNLTASTNNIRYNETLNNASQSSWNETFTASGNKTFWVTIPQNSSVINAKLNLSGYHTGGGTNYSIRINSTSADGFVEYAISGNCDSSSWDTAHDTTTGTSVYTTVDWEGASAVRCDGFWTMIRRSFLYFDTSSIPDDATIENVTIYIHGKEYAETTCVVMKGTQADSLTTADYDAFTGSEYGNIGWSFDWNAIIFNSQGRNDINKTGTTKTAIREYTYDYSDSQAGSLARCGFYFNESGANVPYLNITYSISYPNNPYLDVSGDGDTEWSYTGEFNHTNNQTSNFSSEINSYLSTCSADSNGNCNVSFILHSDTAGKIQISAINITYDYNTSVLYDISYQSEVIGYYLNHTSSNASVNVSTVGYYTNSTDNYCEIDGTRYTPTGSPKYCPLSETHNRSNKWTNHSVWFNTLDNTAPAISSITYQPSCVQLDTTNMIWSFQQMDNRNTSNNDLTQSYCNFTSPANVKYQINSSNVNDNANVTCEKAFNETGTWYIRMVAVDLNSNTGQSSLYAFDVQASCGTGEGSPGGGGGGYVGIEVPVEVPIEPCIEGWFFDTETQKCLPKTPITVPIERKLVEPILPDAKFPINLVAPFHIILSLFVLIPTLAKGKVAKWK